MSVTMESINPAMACILLQVLLFLDFANTNPVIDVKPSEVIIGLSSDLDVNCTFILTETTSMANMISVILSRGNALEQNFTEIAAVTILAAPTVSLFIHDGATTEGYVNAAGVSFLHLHWENPVRTQSGLYKCSVQGLDSVGRDVTVVSTALVTDKQLDTGDLVDQIRQMNLVIKGLEESASERNEDVRVLEQTVSYLDAHTKQLQQSVSRMDSYTTQLQRNMTQMDSYAKLLEHKVSALENERLNRMSDLFESPPLYHYGNKYYVSKEGFYEIGAAMAMCHVYGGYLVEIDHEREYRAIQAYIQQFDNVTALYIAGTDEGHEGHWVFQTTNKSLSFTDWWPGEPTHNTDFNCAFLSIYRSWRMASWQCYTQRPFCFMRYMCEIPRPYGNDDKC